MPNQRKSSKAYISGWYEEGLVEDIRRLAEERGISVSKLVEELLEAAVADYNRKHRSRTKYPQRPDAGVILNEYTASSSSKDIRRKARELLKKALSKPEDDGASGDRPKPRQ